MFKITTASKSTFDGKNTLWLTRCGAKSTSYSPFEMFFNPVFSDVFGQISNPKVACFAHHDSKTYSSRPPGLARSLTRSAQAHRFPSLSTSVRLGGWYRAPPPTPVPRTKAQANSNLPIKIGTENVVDCWNTLLDRRCRRCGSLANYSIMQNSSRAQAPCSQFRAGPRTHKN